jgi:hypothetical protein
MPPPALAGKPSDEQLLAQNILFLAATGKNPAAAAFAQIGGSIPAVREMGANVPDHPPPLWLSA